MFNDGGDKFYRELERLLEMLADQRRQLESPADASMPLLRQSETAEAQVIMAAQRRVVGDGLRRK